MRTLILAVAAILPWPLKRLLLVKVLRFCIPSSAYIGLSWLDVKRLEMAPESRIGHFNVFKNLDLVQLGASSRIGRFNLFTCVPSSNAHHYSHIVGRETAFRLGRHSAITMRHLIDCNAPVTIGDFTTIAGYASQFLTHSIDLVSCRQDAKPIAIGSYCFIGTACVLLGGASLPDYSVLAACSCMRDAFENEQSLYAGVPAAFKKRLPEDTAYWVRSRGWVA
jgi:acetyltransferase-like isoleucine patch superfamily enzyme